MQSAANNTVPRYVLLFSGHMIDARGRAKPRFPAEAEGTAAAVIAEALDEFGAGELDLGITEGACGGDLLFAEALLMRGGRLELHLPFPEEEFVRESVAYEKRPSPVPDRWHERYQAVRTNPAVSVRIMPDELGPLPAGTNPYERCNLWMLDDAMAFGGRNVRFICLWNGEGGDGPGGTAHLMQEVRRCGGDVRWLDTRKLWRQDSAVE